MLRGIPNKRMFNGKAYLLVDSGYPNRMKAKADNATEYHYLTDNHIDSALKQIMREYKG